MNQSLIIKAAGLTAVLLLASCASITNGTHQKISLTTKPKATLGAACDLKNSKGAWHAVTPATVKVHRAFGALTVVCKKHGFRTATKKVESSTKKMVYGNIIFGGIIGAGIDTSNGAAYSYPKSIALKMRRR